MIDLEVTVDGVERVQSGLIQMHPRLRAKLVEAMIASVTEIGIDARSRAPRGATGRVQGSIHASVREERTGVVGRVTDSWYVSRFVEGGVHAASMQVRSYLRRNRAADVQAIGKRGQALKRKSVIGVSAVKAYTRSVHIEPHPFMQPAWLANRSSVEGRFAAAVDAVTGETP